MSDIVLSSDGQFALSGSWDSTLRLWDLTMGTTTRRFVGHTKDVLSVAFSADNRFFGKGKREVLENLELNVLTSLKFKLIFVVPLIYVYRE